MMTIEQLYKKNIGLQSMSASLILSAYRQNYDVTIRTLRNISEELVQLVEGLEIIKKAVDIDEFTQNIMAFLKSILDAQKAEDYILVADLVDLQLLPFLLSMQDIIRDNFEVDFFQENWDYNIRMLSQKDSELAGLLEEEKQSWLADENPSFWLEPTNSGLMTLGAADDKGCYYLHSNSNPKREALEFARNYFDAGSDSYVFFGLGLGYHCEALANLDEGAKISIYESSLSVILQALLANPLDWLWSNDNINLVYDNGLDKMAKQLAVRGTTFVIHSPSMRHIEDETIRERLHILFIRDSGIRNMLPLMETNFRENIKNSDGNIDELEIEFKGKTVVIVAAGPSLDKNIGLLKNKPEGMIILATGTVFRKLINLGIEVDYVIMTDASKRVYAQISGLEGQGVPMLYLSTAYKGFSANYSGKKYIIMQKDFNLAEEYAADHANRLYKTGGSVTTLALDICIRLGCARIAFIGLDLAYTDNLAHAEGTSRRVANDIEEMPVVKGYRFDDEKANIIYETVYSSRLFNMYREWFTKRLGEDDVKQTVYDATEGGSVIEGLHITTLEHFLAV